MAQQRPRIGLALSGGGAKGLAHIGVLKVIEQSGIPIDYIVGTSMGAVVGVLYAAGYSADSIAKIALWENWDDLLSNKIILPRIAIEEKGEFEKYIAEFPFYKKSLHLPVGVIEGQELENELTRLTTPVYDKKDFSQFPRPFKCVATNVLNGQVVLIENGNIAEAVRASMSLPSLFTPVKINGQLLVDGGLVRNFPANHLKPMGADIIIGVNLSQSTSEEELNNLFNMLTQVIFLGDIDDTEKQKKICNILIEPDLSGYGPASFNATDTLIKRGYDAAIKQLDTLVQLGLYLKKNYEPILPVTLNSVDSVYIESIEVTGLDKAQPSLIKGKTGIKEKTYINPNTIPASITKAFGTRYFTKISYELIPQTKGVKLRMKAKENHLNHFKFAINYNTLTKASLILNFTSRDLFIKNSRWLTSVSISDFFRFKTEYFKYLGPERNFGLNLGVHFDRTNFPIYDAFARTALYRRNYLAVDARLQRTIGANAFGGIGLKSEYSSLKYDILSSSIPYDGSTHQYEAYFLYHRNSLNRTHFPTSGTRSTIEAGYFFNVTYDINAYQRDSVSGDISTIPFDNKTFNQSIDREYFLFRIYAEHYYSLSSKLTLINSNFVGSMFNLKGSAVANTFNQFQIGGLYPNFRLQVPFSGFLDYEIRTNNFVGTQLGLQYEVRKNIFVTGRGNLINYNDKVESFIKKDEWIQETNYLLGYGLTAGYLSFLGPIELTIMRNETANLMNFYVNMGFLF